jgi:hypothetical protein
LRAKRRGDPQASADLLDHLPPEGVLITKRSKPLAKVVPAGVGD